MKYITLFAATTVVLAACKDRTPTAPATPETGLNGSLLFGLISAPPSVTSCQGIGLIASINVQYGSCATDANGGRGSVEFSGGGFTAVLSAKTQRGAEQVASFWESNGPVNAARSAASGP